MNGGVFIKRVVSILILTLYLCGIILGFTIKPQVYYKPTNTVYSGICLTNSKLCKLSQYETVTLAFDEHEVDEVTEEQPTIEVDENEVDLLARAIYWECGLLGDEGMHLCGCVILNRISSDMYPNDLYSVLYQNRNGSYQYDIARTGLINKKAEESAYEIARNLLINGSTIPNDVLFQAQFRQGSYVYKQIGNTYFCGL